MRKIIKVNLIILIIFCISINCFLNISIATSEESNDEQQEESEFQEGAHDDYQEGDTEVEEEGKKDLDQLQLEKSELENEIVESNNQIGFIEEALSKNVVEIAEIEQNILDKEMEIQTLQAQARELQRYVDKAKYELELSNTRYNSRKSLLEKRIVAMYEMGQVTYLDILFNSKNILDLISNYYLLEEIASADNNLLEEVKKEQKYNKELKESLEMKQAVIEAYSGTVEKNSIALKNMAFIKEVRVKNLTEEEQALYEMVEEYQKQITEIETEIRLLAIANVGSDYVGGTMAWPVPGYTRITSQFGMRTHPITGVYKLHTGVDIGAPRGALFIAANDGIVTYAGQNRAYGNMVIVNHGGGVTTLYAHGSEILVNVGDQVLQGTPVLKVGSTGYSTGPHAHFEVRINGEYVQPLDYITSYSTPSNNVSNTVNMINNTINGIVNEIIENATQVENVVEEDSENTEETGE